ncbi:MAG: hypothetical protein KDB86_08930 [Actinobacteria bacterium]|nr:hypothetical protein [Actinomycetota bacterium]MCB9390536.1 hypothetical protein [Acidimicrobiia bacterium]
MDQVVFLSDDWIAALDEAAMGRTFATGTNGFLFIREVTNVARIAFTFEGGRLHVRRAADDLMGATLVSDYQTAAGLAVGQLRVQDCFETGSLRLRGPVRELVEHKELIRSLDDVFGEVRSRTVFDRSA